MTFARAAWPPFLCLRLRWPAAAGAPLRALAALLMALCGTFAAPLAHADIWGYVDDRNVAHFAPTRLDDRYELFFRGGESFDAGRGAAPSAAGPRLPGDSPLDRGVAAAPPKLLAFFEVSPSYKAVKHLLREAALTHGIDYELLQALIATESGFDTTAVSPKGAVGLMQLIPPTAERYGVRGDKNSPIQKKLTDPKTNIRAGSSYLSDLIGMFPGQIELAIAAYNAGEGAVQRAGNKIPNYPETRNYVKTVMQLYTHLKPPALSAGSAPAGRVRMEMMGGLRSQNDAGAASRLNGVTGLRGRSGLPPSAGAASVAQAETADLKAVRD